MTDQLSQSEQIDINVWKLKSGNKYLAYLAYLGFYFLFVFKLVIVRLDIVYPPVSGSNSYTQINFY